MSHATAERCPRRAAARARQATRPPRYRPRRAAAHALGLCDRPHRAIARAAAHAAGLPGYRLRAAAGLQDRWAARQRTARLLSRRLRGRGLMGRATARGPLNYTPVYYQAALSRGAKRGGV